MLEEGIFCRVMVESMMNVWLSCLYAILIINVEIKVGDVKAILVKFYLVDFVGFECVIFNESRG